MISFYDTFAKRLRLGKVVHVNETMIRVEPVFHSGEFLITDVHKSEDPNLASHEIKYIKKIGSQ